MMDGMTLVNFVPPLGGETMLPLGPLYITAVLELAGCEVDFRDYQLAPRHYALAQERIVEFLSRDGHDTLGISCFFNTLPFLLPALEHIKHTWPEKTIILGGPGPSSVAEPLMRRFPFIDVVVRGEGERTVHDLARNVPLSRIAGIIYRQGQEVVVTASQRRIRNLDGIPFPAYDRVPVNAYSHVGIMAARGCPYHCAFCDVAPLWGRQTERRSVANLINEIQLLREHYNLRTFVMNDDTFVLDREWVFDFCRALRSALPDVTWRCMGRINLMDEELIETMAIAGCVGIQYGVESGSERVLDRIGKQIAVAQVPRVIEQSVEAFGSVVTTFMWGFPFESMEDLYETIYLMSVVAQRGAAIKLLLLSPAPLSSLYAECTDQLIFSEDMVSNLLQEILDAVPTAAERQNIVDLIRRNPDVFSSFYYVNSSHMAEKVAAVRALGLF
jgi:radical SAM superfamily enzyme YgiQ (UPF0313 family)